MSIKIGENTMSLVFQQHGIENLHDLQRVFDAVEIALGSRNLKLPTNADEAELMEKVGFHWIKEHAPERLSASGAMRPAYRWQQISWDGRINFPTEESMVLVRRQKGENRHGEPRYNLDMAYKTVSNTWLTPAGQPVGGFEEWCEIPK